MAVREIRYNVSANGITPATIQTLGVQREHKATKLIFDIEYSLYQNLLSQAKDGKLVYRFDAYNGEGGLENYDTADLTDNSVCFTLEKKLTKYGGTIKVILVITLVVDEKTEMELYSFPASLRLTNLPWGEVLGKEKNEESISTLSQIAKKSSEKAIEAAEIATDAMERTESARAALEGDTEWIFDGGDAEGNVDIGFVVDNEMSDSSNNAVANKVVKAYIDELIKFAKLEAHPIGSYYWSADKTNPAELFGGEWVQVQGKFILAAGTYTDKNGEERSFEVGETDNGEYRHTLIKSEMPSHNHKVSDKIGYYVWGGPSDINKPGNANAAGIWWTSLESLTTGTTGNSQPHNNMPPYEVAYCWKRTA